MDDGIDLGFDFDMEELDFDLEDFSLWEDTEPDERTRILIPTLDAEIITHTCHFCHAEEFARQVRLGDRGRTYAWVSGAFIFGDIPEALWRQRGVSIKELYVASLSISEENIDSWAGLMSTGMIERFDLLLSGYFYSHEKYKLIPLIYERLDKGSRFNVAYGPYHCKLMCIRTYKDNLIVIHGSANARSSKNVEQVMIEVNDKEIYDFNATQIHEVVEKYGTVNHKARQQTRREVREYFDNLRKSKEGDKK